MPLSSAEKYLMRDAIKGFRIQLQSLTPLPLLDFNQALKDINLRSLLQQKKRDTITEFLSNISNLDRDKRSVIMKELELELGNVIESHMGHVETHKRQLESLSAKLEDAFCEGYRGIAEVHLSHNTHLDLETLHIFLQAQKEEVINRFGNHWKPGDSDFHQLRKAVLEGKLASLQKEVAEEQKQFLENERIILSELKEGVLKLLEQLQKHMKSVKLESIPKRLLEEELKKIEQFVDEKGVFGMEEFKKIHEALMEKIKAATIGLNVAEENMLPEIARSLAKNLDVQLRSYFQDQTGDEVTNQQAPAESVSNQAVVPVPVIDLDNEPPRKRLRTPFVRLEKLQEPIAETSKQAQVDVDDIQIIEIENDATQLGQQKEQKRANDAKVFKVFMNSKKALTRAEKGRLLLEEDEAASQIQVISQKSPSRTTKSRGRPRSSVPAAGVIPKPHPNKRRTKSTSFSELNKVPSTKPGSSKSMDHQTPQSLDVGVTNDKGVNVRYKTLTEKQRRDLERYGATDPSKNLTKSIDAVARNVTNMEEPTVNRISSEGLMKRRRLNPDQEEVAGSSKKARLNEIPTPVKSSATSVEATECPLIFKLTSKYITMGTQVGDSFQHIKNWNNELSTLSLVGFNKLLKSFVCGSDAVKCRRKWSATDFLVGSDYLFPTWSEKVSLKLGQGEKITHEITVEFLLGFLFKSMKERAQNRQQKNFLSAIVTVPIWFCSSHRIQVKDAGKIAGFREIHLVNEESVESHAMVSGSAKDDISKLVFVLSESFNVVSATLYEFDKSKLTMVKHTCFRHQSGAPTINVQNRYLVKKVDELCQTLAIYSPRGNYRKFATFSMETPWNDIFKNVAEKNGFKIIETCGSAVLGKMNLEEIKTFCVEHLPEEFYFLDHLGTECQFLNHGKSVPKQFQLHMLEQGLSQSESTQPVQILQKNLKDGTVTLVGELDSVKAVEYAKKQKWYCGEMKDIIPLSATLEVSSEGIFTFKNIAYDHGRVQERIGDFVWTRPQNLENGRRSELMELIHSIWMAKKN